MIVKNTNKTHKTNYIVKAFEENNNLQDQLINSNFQSQTNENNQQVVELDQQINNFQDQAVNLQQTEQYNNQKVSEQTKVQEPTNNSEKVAKNELAQFD